MRGYVPLLLLLGLAGIYCGRGTGRRVGTFATLPVAGMVVGLATYDIAWAADRFLGTLWYAQALLSGSIAVGMGCFGLALAYTGIAVVRLRVFPRWAGLPLAIAGLCIACFLVAAFATSGQTRYQVVNQGEVYISLAFGLGWLPLGLSLLLAGTRREHTQHLSRGSGLVT